VQDLARWGLPDEIDVLVAGGGTSGAALAGLLARDTDLRVVVLEAGPDYGALADGRWPRELLDASTIPRSHDWGYAGIGHASHIHLTDYDRARVIGGCSAHNGCVALLGHRRDYDHWAELGNDGWDWESVAPAFERARQGLRVRLVEDHELTPFQRRFIDGAVAAGIPRVRDMNDPDDPVGVASSPVNIFDGMRWNTALGYLDPVRGQPNLTVLGNVLIDRVVIEGGRAVAVDALIAGEPARISAARIVVAAGAYGSPAILLRSGIGPADELRALDIAVTHDLPGVGRGLTDHPGVHLQLGNPTALGAEMDAQLAAGWLPDEQTLAKARSRHCAEAFDLHVYAVSHQSKATGAWGYLIEIANVTPRATGTVKLASTRPSAAPLIEHAFLSDPDEADLEVLVDGVELAGEILETAPLVDAFGPGPGRIERADLAEYVRSNVGIYYHPACSCRMGPAGDATVVVDPRGKVHGLDSLYICDASIFPVIMRANTTLPAVMLAEHMASWIGDLS
jgi:choline dehydrogenase